MGESVETGILFGQKKTRAHSILQAPWWQTRDLASIAQSTPSLIQSIAAMSFSFRKVGHTRL